MRLSGAIHLYSLWVCRRYEPQAHSVELTGQRMGRLLSLGASADNSL